MTRDERHERERRRRDARAAARGRGRARSRGRCRRRRRAARRRSPATSDEDDAPRRSGRCGQAIGIQTCDQPYSAAKPTVPIRAPQTAPKRVAGARAGRRQRDGLDQRGLDEVERASAGSVSPSTGPTSRPMHAADHDEVGGRAERAAAAGVDAGGDQRDRRPRRRSAPAGRAAGTAGTPKSNSAWKVESPIRRPPATPAQRGARRRSRGRPRRARAGRRARAALDHQHRVPISDKPGAADQHQVGRPPEGHVLAEEAVPDVVEREAERARRRRRRAARRRRPARTSRRLIRTAARLGPLLGQARRRGSRRRRCRRGRRG